MTPFKAKRQTGSPADWRLVTSIRNSMTRTVVPHEFISKDDADIFCSVLESVLHELSFLELRKVRLFGKSGIVISFDKDWQPFLGHTLGYNNLSKPPRLAITSSNRVLDIAKTWLEGFGRPQSAGRVFVNRKGVVCVRQTLGTWQWDADDPVIRLRRFCDSIQNARFDEELRAASDSCIEAKHKETQGDPAAAALLSLAKQRLQRIDREYLFDLICRSYDDGTQFAKDLLAGDEKRQRPGRARAPHIAVRIVKRR